MSNKPILCKNCKHFKSRWTTGLPSECTSFFGTDPKFGTDLVNGKKFSIYPIVFTTPREARHNSFKCGIDAKYFEPNNLMRAKMLISKTFNFVKK